LIRYLETNPDVEYLQKMKSEIEAKISSIECMGANLTERERREYFASVGLGVLKNQLKTLDYIIE
jgi:hypothetical protein